METIDFLASVKTEVLAQEDEEFPVIDLNPPPDASPGYVVAAELLGAPIAPVGIKVEQNTIDEESTVWNVAFSNENTENPNNVLDVKEESLFIDEQEDGSGPGDPDFQPVSDNDSDDLTTYPVPDHDYTPMAGVDPSRLTHIEILDCQQDKKKGYNCPHCLYTTRRYHHFQSHIVCHSDEKPFHCNQCDFRTARKMALVTHSRYKHSDVKLKCGQCEFTTKHSSSLKLHIRGHAEEKNFSCPRCDFTTKNWPSLKSHLVQHTDIKALKCQYCDFCTKHAASLRYHLKVHASERTFKCDECDFTATSASNLQQHKLRHTDVRPFQCELCGLKFKSNPSLKHHVKSVHLNVKPYKCKLCPKSFCNSGNLYRHQTVHGGYKKLFECPECHIEFTLESNLKRHQKKHENPVSYRCRLCLRTFTELTNLCRHINTVHLRAIQIPCPYCNKTLTTSTTLRGHIKRCHPERWSDHNGKLEVNKFMKKSAVTKNSLVSSEAGLAETVDAGDEILNPGGRRRTVLPRNEAECTIIEPDYDVELIDTLSRCDTSLEVTRRNKKKIGIGTKTLAGPGPPMRRGRPPNQDKSKAVIEGKGKQMSKLVIRKPLTLAKKSKLAAGKFIRKSMQQGKAIKAKGKSKFNSGGLSGTLKKKRGRPAEVPNGTTSSGKSGNASGPVKKIKTDQKNVWLSKTSAGKKRGKPKKTEAATVEREDGSEEDLFAATTPLDATPGTRRGRPKKSAETPSSVVVEESIEADESDESFHVSNPSPSLTTLDEPVKKRKGRPPKSCPPETHFSISNPSPSLTTLDQPVKKRRGRPPKNRPPETVSIPEADIVYEADIPVGSTCGEIRTEGRHSEREGLFRMMMPLTADGEGASDEQSGDNDYEEVSAVESVPDADHLYAAPPETSVTPASHPSIVENSYAQTQADNDPALAANNVETEHVLSGSPVEVNMSILASDSLDQINKVLAKSPVENEVVLVVNPAETEPLSSKSPDGTKSACSESPAVDSDLTPESGVAPSTREIPPIENAVVTSTRPGGDLSNDVEEERTCLGSETRSEMGQVNQKEVGITKDTIPEEQSSVMEYFGLQRKLTESEQRDSEMPASVHADGAQLVGAGESIITGTQQIESPDFTLGTMREIIPGMKGYEGISGLLRQAMIRNKIRGRPWITGTAKERQRYLQEKAQMASKKAKRGRPPKIKRPGHPKRSENRIKPQPVNSDTTRRLGRPKGSKNRVPTNITDSLRKSGRQPKASQKMLEHYESNSGDLCNIVEKRNLSEKFQKMIDSLINKADGDPEFSDSDAGGATISDVGKGKVNVRKSRRVLKASAKKQDITEEVEGFEETGNSGSDSKDEGPPLKKARLAKVNQSPKRGKTSCLVFSARNAKGQKSSLTTRIEGVSSRKGLVLKTKKQKRNKIGNVKMGGRCSPRGRSKTPRKERCDKGIKRVPLQSSLPRKEQCDKGLSKGLQRSDGFGPVRRNEGILHGLLHSDKPRKERLDKGVKKGPLNSTTPRKVHWDKGLTRKDREWEKEKQMTQKSLKQTSRQTSSAARSSDQNFCMVPMKDFSMLLQTAGKVVYVLPADSHLGRLAAASNSVMCLVPQSDNVVIPSGAIPVQAVSSASVSETMPSASTKDHSEPETIESSEKVNSDQFNQKSRKVRSDIGQPRQNGSFRSLHVSDSESHSGTGSNVLDGSVVKTPRKVRSDKGIPRKQSKTPSQGIASHLVTVAGAPLDMNSGQTKITDIKKRRKQRSDKGVPRKFNKSHSQPDLQPVHSEADSLANPESHSADEHSGIGIDPRECLSFNASSRKPRKVRSDKGIPKGSRKRSKGPHEKDMGTVIKKKSGRPKMIQTSKDGVGDSSIGGSPVVVGTSQGSDLKNVSSARKVGRPRKVQKKFDEQESSVDSPAHFEDSSRGNPESTLTLQFSKRQRKPKVDMDFVNFEDAELQESGSEQNSSKIHEKETTLKECFVPAEKVVRRRGRPPKNTCPETSGGAAAKWMKVTIPSDGVVTTDSSGKGRGRGVKMLAATAVFSPSSVKKPMTNKSNKHTARKSFPQANNALPTGTSQTSLLYSDIFPGGGIPVPVMERNPVMSQRAHAGAKIQTSTVSEADEAVIALAHSDPSVKGELIYVDLVMDPSLAESQQFTYLSSETDGLQGTPVRGIEAKPQSVKYEIIEASHLQPLLD
ncbi:uncharacterized protein LOC135487031 [Lineus longissimus]|uniref:uncharacterized protein LOC135487031 n=1 Tax=Lineus longissimus TaxID=88925 RepID=UPI00315D92F9